MQISLADPCFETQASVATDNFFLRKNYSSGLYLAADPVDEHSSPEELLFMVEFDNRPQQDTSNPTPKDAPNAAPTAEATRSAEPETLTDRIYRDCARMVLEHGSATKTERVTVSGDPRVGKVDVYQQVHVNDGVTGFEDVLAIGKVQEQILRELLARKPEHVFEESRTKEYQQDEREATATAVTQYFPQRTLPDKLESEQLVALALMGAAPVYRELTGAKLHPTLTPREYERYIDYQAEAISRGEPLNSWNAERESIAMREVSDFLRKHKGSNVALVFGRGHYFGLEDFPEGKSVPEVRSIDWPGLAKTPPICASDFARSLKPFPELQTEFLRKVGDIRGDCFPDVQTEEGQLLVLQKMIPLLTPQDPNATVQSQIPRDFFMNSARTPKVREAVEALYAPPAKPAVVE